MRWVRMGMNVHLLGYYWSVVLALESLAFDLKVMLM